MTAGNGEQKQQGNFLRTAKGKHQKAKLLQRLLEFMFVYHYHKRH